MYTHLIHHFKTREVSMRTNSIDLVWIVVKDFKNAVKFYTEVAGLKVVEMKEEWGWAGNFKGIKAKE